LHSAATSSTEFPTVYRLSRGCVSARAAGGLNRCREREALASCFGSGRLCCAGWVMRCDDARREDGRTDGGTDIPVDWCGDEPRARYQGLGMRQRLRLRRCGGGAGGFCGGGVIGRPRRAGAAGGRCASRCGGEREANAHTQARGRGERGRPRARDGGRKPEPRLGGNSNIKLIPLPKPHSDLW
jgi:hypothetical protein